MLKRHSLLLSAIAVVSAVLYSVIGLVQFTRYRTGIYDLAIFDQVVRSYSHFDAPGSIIKGQWNDLGEPLSIFSDHLSPILALIAPFYWVHDGPETLLIVQAALFASAAFPFWVFMRRLTGVREAYLLTIAYLLSWPVAAAVAFHFHEFAFVPLLTALLFERWQAGRRPHVALVALCLLAVKEDVGLLVAGIGLVFLCHRRWQAMGGLFVITGLSYTVIATQVVIPAFGGSAYRYWAYSGLGGNLSEAAGTIASHPLHALSVLFDPAIKVRTMLWLVVPLLFMSLASPHVIAALPMLGMRMMATDLPNWWGTKFHYNAAIVMIFFVAGVDGALRVAKLIASRRKRSLPLARPWAALTAVFAVVTVPMFALSNLFDPGFYRPSPRDASATEAISHVPDGALVEAANPLGPNLSGRANVVIWRDMPKRAPWVVADLQAPQPIFGSLEEQRADVEKLKSCGYERVFDKDGYVVLRAPSSASAPVLTDPQICKS